MKKLTITIDLDHPALQTVGGRTSQYVVADVLRHTAGQVEAQGIEWLNHTKLRDADNMAVGDLFIERS